MIKEYYVTNSQNFPSLALQQVYLGNVDNSFQARHDCEQRSFAHIHLLGEYLNDYINKQIFPYLIC